jgi:hypothetical protein
VREKLPETHVLWLNAEDEHKFSKSVRDLNEMLGNSGRHETEADDMRNLRTWLHDRANGRWLLVLDDIHDARLLLDVTSKRHIHRIPYVSHGSMILTSWDTQVASKLGRAEDMQTVNLADELLVIHDLSARHDDDDDDADCFADLDGGLPLASTHVLRLDRRIGIWKTMTLKALVKKLLASNNPNHLKLRRWLFIDEKRKRSTNPESWRWKPAETGLKGIDLATDPHLAPSHTVKDSGYGSYGSASVVQKDTKVQGKAADMRSVRTISSFADLGPGGRLRSINIFASDLVQSLSPDISEVVEGRELVVAAIQDALRAYSYSLEQQSRPDKLSDEREAAHFVRQQSQ